MYNTNLIRARRKEPIVHAGHIRSNQSRDVKSGFANPTLVILRHSNVAIAIRPERRKPGLDGRCRAGVGAGFVGVAVARREIRAVQ